MKYLKYILPINLFLFFSCENEELLSPELDYVQKVVVQCQLSPDMFFPGILITKTLPLDENYDLKSAEIKDATLYLKVNYSQIIPLHYTGNGLYKPLYDFRPHEGDYYELFGEWNNYSLYAVTKIPIVPVINKVTFNSSEFYPEADVKIFENEVYAALWAVNIGYNKIADDFYNVSVPQSNTLENNISVRSASYPSEYRSPNYNGRRSIIVYSFDRSFNEYFKTKVQNEEINNPYIQGSGSTFWNVKGENVIGMFIGVSKSDLIPVN